MSRVRRRVASVSGITVLFLLWLLACQPLQVIRSDAPAALPLVQPGQPLPQAILYEARQAVVEWPPVMRVGDGERIRLLLEMDPEGKVTPTLVVQGTEATGAPVFIPNLYDTHWVFAEARLDMAGMQVSPQGSVVEALLPGKPVIFYWSLATPQQGFFEGTLWLHLLVTPKEGGPADKIALLAKPVSIEARNFLGLPVAVARWTGLVGAGLSVVLGLPFIEQALAALWKRIRRRKSQEIESKK